MIDPKLINLSALPSVSLDNRKRLPQTAGIYMAIDAAETVQYIGRSNNLRKRWLQHHCQGYIANGGQIAYLEVNDVSLLPEIEKALILWFDPPLNQQLRAKKVTVKVGKNFDINLEDRLKDNEDLLIVPPNLIASIYWNTSKGKRLEILRGKESMQSLANRAGIAWQLIQRLEKNQSSSSSKSGKPPSITWETLESLCRALSISVEDFLQIQAIKNPASFSDIP